MTVPPIPASAGGSADALRAERDRFLAFAFAAADALIEIGADWSIRFAAGATRTLLGTTPEELVGRPVLDLVAPTEQPVLHAALDQGHRSGRFAPLVLAFGRNARHLTISGSTLPGSDRSLFLALRAEAADGRPTAGAVRSGRRNRLHDRDDFARLAWEVLETAGSTPAYRLSLVEADGLDRLMRSLDRRVADKLMESIAALLCDLSLGGETAAQLGGNRFALVHDRGVGMAALRRSLSELVKRSDPSGEAVTVAAASLELIAEAGREADGAQALVYAINSFASGRDEFNLHDLADGSQPLLRSTIERIGSFRQVIESGRFDVAFQPVVELASRRVHHYEALVRFPTGGSPYESIIFAESVGLIGEFDLAMAEKVLARLTRALTDGRKVIVGINVSGRSLESPAFSQALSALLGAYHATRGKVLFEVTESAEIRDLAAASQAIDRLRSAGYGVCLDDFGAGASAFNYLRALTVDFVKIDGRYIRGVAETSRDRPFVRAIVQLCRELGIRTIGEMVETEAVAELLVELGIEYAQGYLFGRPMLGLPTLGRAS